MDDSNRPVVKLLGEDGNAYAIIGACRKSARKAGWGNNRINELVTEMTSGDYNNLLMTAMKYFEVK